MNGMNIKAKIALTIGVLVSMIVLLVALSVANLQILTATEPDSPAAGPGLNRALIWITVIGGICILIGIGMLIKLPASINSPIKQLADGILEIANHNYDVTLNLKGGEELVEVSKNFNRMARRLNEYHNSTLSDLMASKRYMETIINSINVRDFGKGIDPRYHNSIFEHYFRVPGTKVQGSGLGGLGIVLFTIALLPLFSGSSQQLFLSEATGVTHDKIHPKAKIMARYLWLIYIGLTLVETILLMCGGMNLFDAICHSFATTATGGFSTKQDSVSYWHSPFIEYVISIFMILSGVNFSLYYMALKGKYQNLLRDRELHWFLKSVGILTGIITIALFVTDYYDLETAFRKALFQVATTHTSCGFATDDYNLWPQFTWMLLLFAMLSGGCTGSTSGGVKNLRLLIIAQNIRNQFKQMLHPRAVLPVRVNKEAISSQVSATVYTFFATYLVCIFVGWTLLMCFGVGLTEAMSTVVSAIGNVGPGLGAFGPVFSWAALPDAAKWILSVLMFIGRLEIFGILLLFYRGFWEDN